MSKFIILLAAACLALPAAEGGQSGKCHGDKLRQHVLERFDTDKDGKLSDAEKAAAKAARKEHREERKDKIDSDDDGKVSEAERAAARAAWAAKLKEKHPKLFAKIDSDGNGEISQDEAQAARKARHERRQDCKDGKEHAVKRPKHAKADK